MLDHVIETSPNAYKVTHLGGLSCGVTRTDEDPQLRCLAPDELGPWRRDNSSVSVRLRDRPAIGVGSGRLAMSHSTVSELGAVVGEPEPASKNPGQLNQFSEVAPWLPMGREGVTAVTLGLRALPMSEPLYRERMQVESAAGNPDGVRGALAELAGDLSLGSSVSDGPGEI